MKKIFSSLLFFGLLSCLLIATSCTGTGVLDPVEVSFESNGGTTYETLTVEALEVITLPTPEKLGHDFVGWYNNSDLKGDALPFEYEATKSITLYAKWRPYNGVVHFESNGGTQYNSIAFNCQYIELPTPERVGHVFAGWYGNAEFTGDVYTGKFLPKGDMTLYAKWIASLGTVKFVSNGGTAYEDLTFAGQMVTLPTPTRAGHQFLGWYDNASFTGKVYSGDVLFEGDITLYAKWEAASGTVKFVSNGGTQYAPVTVNGQYVQLPTPEKANYTFAGWYDNAEFTGEVYSGNLMPVGEITLYAKWLESFEVVSFNSNGGTTHADMMCTGEAIALPTPFKYGYKFMGWYEDSAFTGEVLGETYLATESVTLYAKWERITYVYLYYGELIDSKRYEYAMGDVITLAELYALYTPEDLIVDDYLGYPHNVPFLSWAYEGADENSHVTVNEDIVVGSEHIILVAQYDYSDVPPAEYLKYDEATGDYTTTGKVAHVFDEVSATSTPYVYSLTVEFAKGIGGAVGPAFRMNMPMTNYQYESGCNYLCPGLGPTSGALQISKVLNGSWSRLISDMPITSLPQSWQDKFNNTEDNRIINVTITIVDYGSSFSVYIDNDLAVTYSNASVLATMTGTDLGVRSSTTPSKLINPTVHYGYEITFDTNIDGITVPSTKWLVGDIELPMLLQENKALAGWYYDEALTKPVDNENFFVNADSTLYAKWSETYHLVSFDSNGGSAVSSVNWVQGKLVLPENPTKMNHKFVGWYYDEACTQLVDPYTFDINENVTLYAKWRLFESHIINNGDGTYLYNKKTEAVLGIVENPIPEQWYYNEYSQTITLVRNAASVGIAFRMDMPSDYTYETTGSYYLSVQFCGTGGLRISQVNNGAWTRIIPNNKDHALTALPQSYQNKFNSLAADANMTVKLTVRDFGSYFEVYLDDELAYTYGQYGETVNLLQYTGNGYGIRSSAGTSATFKDVTVTTGRVRAYYDVTYKQDYAADYTTVAYEDGINDYIGTDGGVLYRDPSDPTTAYFNKFVGWSLTEGGAVVDTITGPTTLYAVYEETPLIDPVFITFMIEGKQLVTKVVERNTALEELPTFDLPYTKDNGNKVFGSGYVWTLNGQEVKVTDIYAVDSVVVATITERVETRNGVIVTQDENGEDVYRFVGHTGQVNQYGGRYGIGLEHLTTITNQTEAKMSNYSFDFTMPKKPTSEVSVRMVIFANDNGTNTQVTGDTGSNQYFIGINWMPQSGSFYVTGKFSAGGKQLPTLSFASIQDCGYKQKYNSWTSGAETFNFRAVYGLDVNGDAWFKFYVDNDLLYVYGDNAVLFDGEKCLGITYKYDTVTSAVGVAIKNFAMNQAPYAGLLGYGVGISMWQDTSLCGGYVEYSNVKNEVLDDQYTINYESNLEGVTVPSTIWTAGRLYLPTIASEDGAILEGWYYDAEFTKPVDPDNFAPTEDTTLYAKWSYNFYMISFNTNGGSAVDSVKWISGSISLQTPKKINYVFDGWYYDAALTQPVDAENFNVTSDTTLHAKWRLPLTMLTNQGNGVYVNETKSNTIAVVDVIENSLPGEGYYVEYTQTVSVQANTGSSGLAFRMSIDGDNQYEGGQTYLFVQYCTRFLRIGYVLNGKYKIIKDVKTTSLPTAWYNKCIAAGDTDYVTSDLMVRDYGSYYEVYVDGELAFTYSDTTILSQITGNGYGIRNSVDTKVTFSNMSATVVAIATEE